ncbi:MAG: hypothetical protein NXY59_06510 [Aigarchaeota archaeon]|nr:hypothetical protein [Candidatus Pelearchaeum maunauluense]
MRSQLAVSSLIVFGVILVAFSLFRFPYTVIENETVIIQASTTTTILQPYTYATTLELIEQRPATTTITTTITAKNLITTTTIATISSALFSSSEAVASSTTPLIIGPFMIDAGRELHVRWRAEALVSLYLLNYSQLPIEGKPESWLAAATGGGGEITLQTTQESPIYLLIYGSNTITRINELRIHLTWIENTTTTQIKTEQKPTTITKTTTQTTTLYMEKQVTTTLTETSKKFYTTTTAITVTETRYSSLNFAIVMGSFLIFAGIMFMLILSRRVVQAEMSENQKQ